MLLVSLAAPARAGEGAEDAMLALRVYDQALQTGNWRLAAAAAEIMVAVDPGVAEPYLATAERLAAGDAEALAQIEDVRQGHPRGCLGCGIHTITSRLAPGAEDQYRLPPFPADATAEIGATADVEIELEIRTAAGAPICADRGQVAYCSWTADPAAEIVVTVRNPGDATVKYHLLTSQM